MGRVSTCQNNCKTIDLRGAQVNYILYDRDALFPHEEKL